MARRLNVVICTPSEATSLTLARSFEQQGFNVRQVRSGTECLTSCAHNCPDLVMLDETLVDPSAAAIRLELQSNPTTESAKIVFLDQPQKRTA